MTPDADAPQLENREVDASQRETSDTTQAPQTPPEDMPPEDRVDPTDSTPRALPSREPVAAVPHAGRIALLAILAYVAFDIGLPLVPIPPPHRLTLGGLLGFIFAVRVLPTAVFMLLQLWVARTVVALRWPTPRVVLAAVASTALWFTVLYFVHPYRGLHPLQNQDLRLAEATGLGLFLTLSLAFLGILLALIVREPNVLLPVALIAMPIDYVGAMTSIGFTHIVEQHAPTIVSNVSVPVPSIGGMHAAGGVHPLAFIGPGDGLFIAFFFAAVQSLAMNQRGTFWWMYSLLTVAMLIVLSPWGLPIAALVPMGLAVIIANWRYFHFKRAEVFAMLYAALVVVAVIGGFYLASHRYLFHGK